MSLPRHAPLPGAPTLLKPTKPYWEMNLEELREATKEFDREMVIDTFKPLSPEMRAQWEEMRRKKSAKAKAKPKPAAGLSLSVESELLTWLTSQAKKRNVSRSRFVAGLLKEAQARAKV